MVIAAVIFIGANHIRHTVFLGLIFGAYLPVFLSEQWHALRQRAVSPHGRAWIPGAAFVCLAVLIHSQISFSRIPSIVPSFRLLTPQSKYPLGALNWIMQTGLQGNILPFFEWGEFIIWHFTPGCQGRHGRTLRDGISEQVYREYSDFLYARPAWRVFLQKYPREMILLHARIKITELMKGEKPWQIAYRERIACFSSGIAMCPSNLFFRLLSGIFPFPGT